MSGTEITLCVPLAVAEQALDVLRSLLGVEGWVELPFVQPNMDSEATTASTGTCRVRALLEDAPVADATLARLASVLDGMGLAAEVTLRPVEVRDWAESWKEHFRVERFGRIVLAPTWLDPPADEAAVVVRLDPGLGFGTGKHATTRMCLEALDRTVRQEHRVLDVGCGSGILSISAAKLGAKVDAVDVDPGCVRVTAENAALNGVTEAVRARTGSLGDRWPFDVPPRAYDVVVANIMTGTLIGLAPWLVAAASADRPGRLILSGIVAERTAEVVNALTRRGAHVLAERRSSGWSCLEMGAGAADQAETTKP